jgi:hypothetical protein
MEGSSPTDKEVAAGRAEEDAKTAARQKKGSIRSSWTEYLKDSKGKWRKVHASSDANFLVELDSSNRPVACYSTLSSRNFCVSAGGIFRSNPPAGKPKCTQS